MKILRIQSLKAAYYDRDDVLLHAAFQVLVDFIEKEHPDKIIDWNRDKGTARVWRLIQHLYRWWTKARPARVDPLDDNSIEVPTLELVPTDNPHAKRMVPWDRKKYAAFDRACKESTRLEKQWLTEDQRNLHKLIEIRPYLWT